jgi:hypothetical protein
MPLLYKIGTDGDVVIEERSHEPAWDDIKIFLDGANVEHVSVLFNGKPAHMYVDEDGLSKTLPFNRKATRIYANLSLRNSGLPTYDDLTKQPPRGVVCIGPHTLAIVGRALLWTGRVS